MNYKGKGKRRFFSADGRLVHEDLGYIGPRVLMAWWDDHGPPRKRYFRRIDRTESSAVYKETDESFRKP